MKSYSDKKTNKFSSEENDIKEDAYDDVAFSSNESDISSKNKKGIMDHEFEEKASDSCEENETESEEDEDFFDDEAMEDNDAVESEVDHDRETDSESEGELAFQAGGGAGSSKKEILKNGLINRIDDFSSNSEDDEDLSDFVVSDADIEYASDASDLPDCEDLSNEAGDGMTRPKKRKNILSSSDDEKVDKKRKRKCSNKDSDNSTSKKSKKTKRNAIDSTDDGNSSILEVNDINSASKENKVLLGKVKKSSGKKKKQNTVLKDSKQDISPGKENEIPFSKKNVSDKKVQILDKVLPKNNKKSSKKNSKQKVINKKNPERNNNSVKFVQLSPSNEYLDIDLVTYEAIFSSLICKFNEEETKVIFDECSLDFNSLDLIKTNYLEFDALFLKYGYDTAIKSLATCILSNEKKCLEEQLMKEILIATLVKCKSCKIGVDLWIMLLGITSDRKDLTSNLNMLSLALTWYHLEIISLDFVLAVFRRFLLFKSASEKCIPALLLEMKSQLKTSSSYFIDNSEALNKDRQINLKESKNYSTFISSFIIENDELGERAKKCHTELSKKVLSKFNTEINSDFTTVVFPLGCHLDLNEFTTSLFSKKLKRYQDKLITSRISRAITSSKDLSVQELLKKIQSYLPNYCQYLLIFNVMVDCLLNETLDVEKTADVIVQLCKKNDLNKRFLKSTMWDAFISINPKKLQSVQIISQFLTILIKERCFNLTALKKIPFSIKGTDDNIVYNVIFKLFYLSLSNQLLTKIFKLTISSPKHKLFKKKLQDMINSNFSRKQLPKHQKNRIRPSLFHVKNMF